MQINGTVSEIQRLEHSASTGILKKPISIDFETFFPIALCTYLDEQLCCRMLLIERTLQQSFIM